MTEEKTPDVVLSDGVSITFDKTKIKRREWAELFSLDQSPEAADEIIARFSGTTAEYIANLSLYDWQLLMRTAGEVVRKPVDPNLHSGSISQ